MIGDDEGLDAGILVKVEPMVEPRGRRITDHAGGGYYLIVAVLNTREKYNHNTAY